jgi:lincosamide nucleotidyltransferase A/C/D/E
MHAEEDDAESVNVESSERRVGRGREPATEMSAQEVLKLLHRLEDGGVKAWLDGGWGVDALLGEQQRQHDDLDLVVELADVPKLQTLLADEGYELLGGAAPRSFEMVDTEGRQVDVHPVTFNEQGDGVYKMRSGEDWIYPAAGFTGRGQVLGQEVRCLSPEVQMLVHTGYELTDKDHMEIRALQQKFGAEPPPGYTASQRKSR